MALQLTPKFLKDSENLFKVLTTKSLQLLALQGTLANMYLTIYGWNHDDMKNTECKLQDSKDQKPINISRTKGNVLLK